MENYFYYLKEMIIRFFQNVGTWFRMRYADPWSPVPSEFSEYGSLFEQYSSGFGFWGWFFFVLFAILLIGFIGAIIFFLVWLIRKYVKFYKSELDKERLREEVQNLQIELYNMTAEKNRVLNLQLGALGIDVPNEGGEEGAPAEGEAAVNDAAYSEVRFPRLKMVDDRYASINTNVELSPNNANITLEEICKNFRNFAASQLGLYYTPETIRALFASLGTGKILILEGISGTGKTSLPYALGRFLQHPCSICSVQPSWHDRSELLGFYNDFTKKFTETLFLESIYEATFRQDLSLIVLDEMNLARIEYYFAEFLSIMEMPNISEWNIDLIPSPRSDDPIHLHDGRLLIPQNAFFIGTANNDDSTFTITDKVYDRAMSIFFDNKGIPFDAPFTESMTLPYAYLEKLYQEAEANYPLSSDTEKKFQELDSFVIANFKLAFGNRIVKQMRAFVPCYVACGGTELDAVDYMFCTKILKKFESLNIAFLRDQLLELDQKLTKLYGKNTFKMSRNKIKDFVKQNA